jgi:hypothetical protein
MEMAINPATGKEYTAAELEARRQGLPSQQVASDPNPAWTSDERASVQKNRDEKAVVQSKDDRVAMALAGYAHGLEHNSPRTPAELAELRWLFGQSKVDPQAVPEPTEEQKKKREAFLAQQKADAERAKVPA